VLKAAGAAIASVDNQLAISAFDSPVERYVDISADVPLNPGVMLN